MGEGCLPDTLDAEATAQHRQHKSPKIRRQPIPVEGQSSDVEVALETCFNRELQGVEEEKVAKSKPGTLPAPSTPSGKMSRYCLFPSHWDCDANCIIELPVDVTHSVMT